MTKAFSRVHETIIFDGEGVVIDSEPIWDQSQREFLLRRGIAYDREKIKPLLAGRSLEDGVLVLQKQFHIPGDPAALARERMEIVRNLFEAEVQFVPGFLEFYRGVSPRYKTCVATVLSGELLAIVTAKLNLTALFDSRIYNTEQTNLPSKPQPDVFLYAARQLGSDPAQCIVIEDSPNGIQAALAAGMFTIALTTTFGPGQLQGADLIVNSFAEIQLPE
jgi:beta-phosphoglucomutase-like phosphatase (HAD superfamily)